MQPRLTRRHLLACAATAAGNATLPAFAQPALYLENTHYVTLPENSLGHAQAAARTPLVTEIFWYGCPHCYEFDPLLNGWVQSKGDTIAFSRMPAVWDAATKQHARLFCATVELGVNERLHALIFDAIHQQRNPLMEEEAQLRFLEQRGVARDAASKALHSFQVDSQLRKAETLVRDVRIPGIPAMIVRGNFMVKASSGVGTYQDQLKVADYLLGARS